MSSFSHMYIIMYILASCIIIWWKYAGGGTVKMSKTWYVENAGAEYGYWDLHVNYENSCH